MGINGPSVLTELSSIDFPRSFPLGFVHLVLLNVVPNLVEILTGSRVPGEGEAYYISPTEWGRLCDELAKSTATLPAVFGSCFRDLSKHKDWIAEDWLNFLLYAAHPLFGSVYTTPETKPYLDLWELLITAVEDCLSHSIRRTAVNDIRERFACFVEQYEE